MVARWIERESAAASFKNVMVTTGTIPKRRAESLMTAGIRPQPAATKITDNWSYSP
jgi:hypothetical protein